MHAVQHVAAAVEFRRIELAPGERARLEIQRQGFHDSRGTPPFVATAINDSPFQGRKRSMRRQIQTVLSNSFRENLLMRVRPSSLPKIHQDTAPILFS